jgi:hypothetical protein
MLTEQPKHTPRTNWKLRRDGEQKALELERVLAKEQVCRILHHGILVWIPRPPISENRGITHEP